MKKVILYFLSLFLLALVCCNNPSTLKNQSNLTPISGEIHENYDTLISIGRKYYHEEKYDTAIRIFDKAVQIDPKRVEGYYFSGIVNAMVCHLKNKSCDEALIAFNNAIRIDPTFRKSYYNRALCLIASRDYENAMNDLNKAIDLDSTDADYFKNRGAIYYILGNNEKACKDFQQSIKLGGIIDLNDLKKTCK